ncbi:hypothetical protein SAMN05216276_1008170 [Streptosporangium subroseum]|uniref:Uncharacterized protein n=1 Tax=Streptosporangium subroseum TaxID=106412 RepID=A0A239E136_9ACTN|nr:hypothetical protein [Streptosporangium subroseum]SNS38317.1 hypothetical protein SAMN05216276_1008170 [Streptosporangium subroseum]
MIDFEYGAYPHRDGLAMVAGGGDANGVTIRRREQVASTVWETHEAYAVFGKRVQLVGTADDKWSAYALIERWYADQDNYYPAWV